VPVAYCQSVIGFQLLGGPHWFPLVYSVWLRGYDPGVGAAAWPCPCPVEGSSPPPPGAGGEQAHHREHDQQP